MADACRWKDELPIYSIGTVNLPGVKGLSVMPIVPIALIVPARQKTDTPRRPRKRARNWRTSHKSRS
ncbi:MAG: hypothetical protein KDA41_08450, partial [Planctomycetales bacterium]|nr:hypothetical protein [Planctomycetales bacterium]